MVEVERPGFAIAAAVQAYETRFGADAADSLEDVGPHRRDDDDVVAGLAEALQGDVDAHHGAAWNRDPVQVDLAAGLVRCPFGDGLAQVGEAAGEGVEGFALVQGPFGSVTDEVRGDDVAFPEPEGDDVGAAEPQEGHLADAVSFEVQDRRADGCHWGKMAYLSRGGQAAALAWSGARPYIAAIPHAGFGLPGRHMAGRPPVLGRKTR